MMATRIKPPPRALYEEDFYVWTQRQAELLRARRYDELHLEHLIEEVQDLGCALKRSIRSRVRTIIEHLLNLQHSPAVDPRAGWRDTVRRERNDLLDDLTPTLRRELGAELGELYARARQHAEGSLRDHGEHAAAEAPSSKLPLYRRADHRRMAAVAAGFHDRRTSATDPCTPQPCQIVQRCRSRLVRMA
jgi:hypothetical protein